MTEKMKETLVQCFEARIKELKALKPLVNNEDVKIIINEEVECLESMIKLTNNNRIELKVTN